MKAIAAFVVGLVMTLLAKKWLWAVMHAFGWMLAAALICQAKPLTCGVERHAVKALQDPLAGRVDYNPTHITIAVLAAFPLHAPVMGNEPRGVEDEEFQTFDVEGDVTFAKREADRDYHIVLRDPERPEATMIIESVDPRCALGSRSVQEIGAARQAIDEAGGVAGIVGKRVHVTGTGFFDRCHGQTGRAPNCIELHPLLSFEVMP